MVSGCSRALPRTVSVLEVHHVAIPVPGRTAGSMRLVDDSYRRARVRFVDPDHTPAGQTHSAQYPENTAISHAGVAHESISMPTLAADPCGILKRRVLGVTFA
jgi:hypothetical protein